MRSVGRRALGAGRSAHPVRSTSGEAGAGAAIGQRRRPPQADMMGAHNTGEPAAPYPPPPRRCPVSPVTQPHRRPATEASRPTAARRRAASPPGPASATGHRRPHRPRGLAARVVTTARLVTTATADTTRTGYEGGGVPAPQATSYRSADYGYGQTYTDPEQDSWDYAEQGPIPPLRSTTFRRTPIPRGSPSRRFGPTPARTLAHPSGRRAMQVLGLTRRLCWRSG